MTKVKKVASILILLIILSSCSKIDIHGSLQTISPTPTSIDETRTTDAIEQNNETAEQNNNQDETLDSYLSKIAPDGLVLTQYFEKDIDNDGFNEVIASYGESNSTIKSDMYLRNIVLRSHDYKYEKIGELSGNIGTIIGIELVRLDGTGKIYVYASQTNEAQGIGLLIYQINENKIDIISRQFPATGAGVYTLNDADNDGIFNMIEYKEYNDIQHHKRIVYYDWTGTNFAQTKIEYEYPINENNQFIYPQKPEDVIQSYLEATYLRINGEIDQLISNDTVKDFNVLDYYGIDGGFEYGLFLMHETISEDNSKMIIKTKDVSSGNYAYFTMIKIDGMWKIDNISKELLQE